MKYRLLFTLLLSFGLLWNGCKDKEEETVCPTYSASWQAPAQAGTLGWLFVSDEEGRLLAEEPASPQSLVEVVTESCSDAYTLSFLSIGPETVDDDGSSRQETVYRLTTVIDAPQGFRWDTLALAPVDEWEVSVANVNSLEQLVWPAERRDIFQGDIVLDPASNTLGFSIPARADEAAYFEIRANQELEPRGLFFPSVSTSSLMADFEQLPTVLGLGEVTLPNTANWRYSLFGLTDSTQTLVDYANQPDLVNGSFIPDAPASGISQFRLRVEQPDFYENLTYSSRTYDFVPGSFPIDLPTGFPEYAYQRTNDQIEIITFGNNPVVYQVRIFDYTGPGPWLDWTIYGTPEDLANFRLPDWPSSVATEREQLIGENRPTAINILGKRFQSNTDYQAFLQALASKETRWPWEQGLIERTVIWNY
jgi:hypothetical protein